MEVLFENRYTMTKKRYVDWAKNPIKKSHFVIFWSILMIFAVLMLMNSILNKDMFYSTFYLLFAAFCIYRAFFRARILLSKYFKALTVNQGASEWERVIQFSDCITVTDGNTKTQYQWNQVVKLLDSKDYLTLVFGNGTGIRAAKDGFTKGSSDALLQFIRREYQNIPLSIKK